MFVYGRQTHKTKQTRPFVSGIGRKVMEF